MKTIITLRRPNPDFDKKRSDEYNFGRQSYDNLKYDVDKSYGLKVPITDYSITKNTTYSLCNISMINVTLFEFKNNNSVIALFVISDSLIKKILAPENKKYKTLRVYIYLKNDEEFQQIEDTMFIAKDEIPSELKKILVFE